MLLTSRRHPFYRALQVRNTLRDDIGIGGRTVQVQTVINQLRTFRLGNFRPNRASQLTTADDAARLKWANWVAEWDSVLFGDVSRFDLHSNRVIFKFDGGNKRLRNVTNLYCQCQISQRRS
jgi:hypothetical protein